mmetsp:Transcript_105140/g.272282  ORF Transcript_105140/g.272282 Transcript_105140/m.272282 type:complete len:179 (-) Transcript_105140:280-816(-)
MVRLALAVAFVGALAAAAALSVAFVAEPAAHRGVPSRTQHAARLRAGLPSRGQGETSVSSGSDFATAAAAGAAAAALGLLVGLASGPEMASAVPRPLPDFLLKRPEYLQGVDAANAAWRPGEVDFVTRSRIEALQFPKMQKELQREEEKLRSVPTKAQRVQRAQDNMRRLAETMEIPA